MRLLDIIKNCTLANILCYRDSALWYRVYMNPPVESKCYLDFPIPACDLGGAEFPATEENPRIFQRWIRRELDRQAEEQEMISKAREEWKE